MVQTLHHEFYESDARLTVADLAKMVNAAAERFRSLHPELTNESIDAVAWCYSYDYK